MTASNGTAVAVREQQSGGALAMWDAEQLEIITTLICPEASPAELALFGQVCQRTGLDPFAKQIYGIKRKGRLTIQTGIDGFRLQAQRTDDYAGQEGPQWCGKDRVWRDVWLEKDPPAAARVGVYRKGWTRPAWGVATWAEYAQMYNGKPTEMWARMPSNQLAKCAEAQALRKAFPAELSGLYVKEEMDQADNAPPVGAPLNGSEPIEGEVVQPWVSTYHEQWTRGAARAREIGAEIPEKVAVEKGKDACQGAIAALKASIDKRQSELDAEKGGTIDGEATPVSSEPSDPAQGEAQAPAPASAEVRAQFDANWQRGIAKAVAVGVEPDDAPPATATLAELNRAQKGLVEAIQAREKLNGEYEALVADLRGLGVTRADVDLSKVTSTEIHAGIAQLREMIADARAQQPVAAS